MQKPSYIQNKVKVKMFFMFMLLNIFYLLKFVIVQCTLALSISMVDTFPTLNLRFFCNF